MASFPAYRPGALHKQLFRRLAEQQLLQHLDHRLSPARPGDATKADDVERLLAGTKAHMAFTDPPYNVSLGSHGGQQPGASRRKLKNDALAPEAWEAFCRGWAQNLLGVVDGALYVCMSTKEWPTVSRILAEAGAHWSDTIIWEKDRFVLGRADYQRAYEPIWYGWREGAKHQYAGGRDQSDVWKDRETDRVSLSPHHEAAGIGRACHRELLSPR